MTKRSEIFQEEALLGIYSNHPHLLLFQKEDWKEYLSLLAIIYDFLEEDNTRVPFEVIKSIAIKFFSQKKIASPENKTQHFFVMAIAELKVLKDSHDHLGQRYLETTRFGKELLQMIENMLTQRTRFSGTGAETLLAALNHILIARQQMNEQQAIEHHKQKIKSYQEDIHRIKSKGLEYAELLPIPHSNEALFSQAEEAAIHILSSVEDVKSAIERQRHEMSQDYFKSSLSVGRKLNAVIDFYENLHRSSEYVSYIQAKNLLSFLDGLSARFQHKNIDHLIHHIQSKDLIEKSLIQRSQLKNFASFFHAADNSIQEKIKSQLKILQQQVSYSMTQDIQGLQNFLNNILSGFLANKAVLLNNPENFSIQIEIPTEFNHGEVSLFHFQAPPEVVGTQFTISELELSEEKALFEALLAAEEATLQIILEKLHRILKDHGQVSISTYELNMGLAEYYVLSEIQLFAPTVGKVFEKNCDINIQGKFGAFVMLNSPSFTLYNEGSTHGNI